MTSLDEGMYGVAVEPGSSFNLEYTKSDMFDDCLMVMLSVSAKALSKD
ncbi:hypothetical protein JCM5805K_0539 [Lactococcus lactis subsp. lactis]|uniref:Uncharacterized protein n=1 Tax=Lactococcus lactis subsp. lactis TaxID=1360 RepID=A0A0B8QLN0_LACLL|nr:hypothetical protein JCM5805K_0539 [Lactococcus lactis subsp. lactis]